eukprot:SAG22_NODE_118_length_19263_cov_16.155813_15_plen_519_part_00
MRARAALPVPQASQQVVGLMVDALRAGVTTYSTFDTAAPYGDGSTPLVPRPKPIEVDPPAYGGAPPMLMYVMAHFPVRTKALPFCCASTVFLVFLSKTVPFHAICLSGSKGNNPIMWKRQMFQDLIHGVKIFDMFDFESSISGYTCDYVDPDGGSYEMVRQSMNELGMMDDIIWNGVAAAGAKVAIMYSDSADAWLSPETTSQGSAKRTLYVLLKHMGLPTDVVTEDDCVAGHLNHYGALYVIDNQISEDAVTAIGAWATAGGQVFITSGGGMLNEYNLTNAAMAALLPVKQTGLWTGAKVSRHNATVFFAKQDLPYAETLDEVTMLASATEPAYALGVFGDKSIFTFAPQPADKTHLLGVFEDGSPAVVNISIGTQGGGITYAGFHPGRPKRCSTFLPARLRRESSAHRPTHPRPRQPTKRSLVFACRGFVRSELLPACAAEDTSRPHAVDEIKRELCAVGVRDRGADARVAGAAGAGDGRSPPAECVQPAGGGWPGDADGCGRMVSLSTPKDVRCL